MTLNAKTANLSQLSAAFSIPLCTDVSLFLQHVDFYKCMQSGDRIYLGLHKL